MGVDGVSSKSVRSGCLLYCRDRVNPRKIPLSGVLLLSLVYAS